MLRASVRFAVDAPGKFVVLNIAFAGSFPFVSTPKSSVGTRLEPFCWCSVRWNDPPIDRLCEPH
jgi:hypothetical protein